MKNIKVTASLEDYLEAIYEIMEEKQNVKAVEISKRLNVKRSSVTEALKNLAEKNLVNYGRYNVISLTPLGIKVAKKVIEKHKTLYDFFTKILGLSSDEASTNACKVEHVISEDVLQCLIAFIEFNNNYYCSEKKYIDEFQKFYEEFKK
ncbi:MAG: metal-dependent transcriptional regulator [Candidatus Gastranaerophilales bacterium]|nr:metal-dependent transcriptional regulator [Candidatus Gastranaerophilales bacterium]